MYFEHFGLNEAPFRITPHTEFFFQGANRGATLEALLYAITHDEGIVKVSGEVGSGKTMLCRVLIERLPKNVEVIYLGNPSLSRDEILLAVADELKIDTGGERASRVLRSLQDHLIRLFSEGRRAVALIDEAHAMPSESLEEIRLLSNLESNRNKLMQIVLFGQPELDTHLDTAAMRPLKERITQSFRLEPLVRGDIESYIDFRMRAAGYRGPNVFTPNAVKRIAEASEGLTRRINILADKSLLAAFASGAHAVTEKEVMRAIADSEFRRAPRHSRSAWIAMAALAAGLALGWSVPLMFSPRGANSLAPHTSAPMVTPHVSPPSAVSPAKPAAIQSPSAQPVAIETAPDGPKSFSNPPPEGSLSRERFIATQNWLIAAPGDQFAIQLLTAKATDQAWMEHFLLRGAKLVPADQLFVYSVKIDGQLHYRVALGPYPDLTSTLNAMARLPALFTAQQPYYRKIERMRNQNRQ